MQTILGASAQIGRELAACLKRDFTGDLRPVSRRPQKVNDTDQLFSADLLDAMQTVKAVTGSEVVYMYPQTAQAQTEDTAFLPRGDKGRVRAAIARELLAAMELPMARPGSCHAAALLPRHEADNLFVSDKFKRRFPGFRVTTLRQGLQEIRDEHAHRAR